MGEAYFYHLTESPLAETLPTLLGKARERGWMIEVRGTDLARMNALDFALWKGDAESFLPHGLAGGPHDADQPILLTVAGETTAERLCTVCINGAPISAAEVATAERVMVVFDALDGAEMQSARNLWKSLTDDGCKAQYWAQEDGRWVKKAER